MSEELKKEQITYLNFLTRSYEGVTKLIAQTKQRILSMPGETPTAEFDDLLKSHTATTGKVDGLETVKNRISREIDKTLKDWQIWTEWLVKIPGLGPYLGAKLIILFYVKFVPVCKHCNGPVEREDGAMICQDCGEAAKGDGLLQYRADEKDFATISKWWAYMGRHTVDGVMPKRKKGEVANWSTPGRTLGFHIGDQFNRQKSDHPYKALLIDRKKKHERNHEDWSKGHIHNAAKNETVKIFLAHFWTVARTMQGKPVSEPYAGALMGHTNIIKPFYWEDPKNC